MQRKFLRFLFCWLVGVIVVIIVVILNMSSHPAIAQAAPSLPNPMELDRQKRSV